MANIRRRMPARAPRRMTDWEANSPQLTALTSSLTGVTTALVLWPRSTLPVRATLTRIIGELTVATSGTLDTIVHCAMVIRSLDASLAIAAFDPTNVADLNSSDVLWQKQFLLRGNADGNDTINARTFELDIKAQRKLREQHVIAFVLEANGGTVQFHVGGRALLKLV